MAVTQIVGPRIAPLWADPVEWTSTRAYEPFTFVTYQGDSYCSRQDTPIGIDISNENYWVKVSDYNAQAVTLQREMTNTIEAAESNMESTIQTAENTMTSAINAAESNMNEAVAGVNTVKASMQAYMNFVTPEMFGGVADGTTLCDDAFAACIASGLPIVLNDGTYLISNSIDICIDKQSLNGVGCNSIIKTNNASLPYLVRFYSNKLYFVDRGVTPKVNGNFMVYGAGADASNEQVGVMLGDGSHVFFGQLLYNITVRNVYICFKFSNHSYKNKFVNLVTDYTCSYAIYAYDISDCGESTQFDNCAFYTGSLLISHMSSTFIDCAIHMEQYTTSVRNSSNVTSHMLYNGRYAFIGCHIEALNYSESITRRTFIETNSESYVFFSNCEFIVTPNSSGNPYTVTYLIAPSSHTASYANNVFTGCDFSGIMENYNGGMVEYASFTNCTCRPYAFYDHSTITYDSRKVLKSLKRKPQHDSLFRTYGSNWEYTNDNAINFTGYMASGVFGNLYEIGNHNFVYYNGLVTLNDGSEVVTDYSTHVASKSAASNISFYDADMNLITDWPLIGVTEFYAAWKLNKRSGNLVFSIPAGAVYIFVGVYLGLGSGLNSGLITDKSTVYLF